MSDRQPLNVRVDEDVRERFREFTKEKKGRVRNEMGRLAERALQEYMDKDRLARVEDRLTNIEQRQNEILDQLEEGSSPPTTPADGRHAHTDGGEQLERLAPQVRDRIKTTIENLPVGEVTDSDIERAVFDAGQTDQRTIEKYRRILEAHGILLPNPRNQNNDEKWIHGGKQFALICEQNNEISVDDLDVLLGGLEEEGRFSEEEYLASLPEDFVEKQDLLVDQL